MKRDVQTRDDDVPDVVKSLLNYASRTGFTVVFYCSLFGDMVTENLCLLRRRQLSGTGVFFCEDCKHEIEQGYQGTSLLSSRRDDAASEHAAEPGK